MCSRDHPHHAARLGQGEPAVALDLDPDLLDHVPDAGQAAGRRDRRVEGVVGVVEGLLLACLGRLPLALDDGAQAP